jgi:hypothetical protein
MPLFPALKPFASLFRIVKNQAKAVALPRFQSTYSVADVTR